LDKKHKKLLFCTICGKEVIVGKRSRKDVYCEQSLSWSKIKERL